MKVDILKHVLVPKHEVLSENKVQDLLEKYKITLKHLPRISSSDPVIKAIEAKPGDVIKITRRSMTAGRTVYYRVVVKPR